MKLYGTKVSRAMRSIWAAEEVGVDYEWIPTSFREESKAPEYLAINPNGRIPALVDGDLVLFESMAINLYLAKTYGGKLYPSDPHDEARALQWTIWGQTELEPHVIPMLLHKSFLPEDQRDSAIVAKTEVDIVRPLAVLDAHLADREYLLGGDFSIADLNVAGTLATAHLAGFDISKYENATRWMSRCTGRPSFARTQAK
jgi:glutathione S-transferase